MHVIFFSFSENVSPSKPLICLSWYNIPVLLLSFDQSTISMPSSYGCSSCGLGPLKHRCQRGLECCSKCGYKPPSCENTTGLLLNPDGIYNSRPCVVLTDRARLHTCYSARVTLIANTNVTFNRSQLLPVLRGASTGSLVPLNTSRILVSGPQIYTEIQQNGAPTQRQAWTFIVSFEPIRPQNLPLGGKDLEGKMSGALLTVTDVKNPSNPNPFPEVVILAYNKNRRHDKHAIQAVPNKPNRFLIAEGNRILEASSVWPQNCPTRCVPCPIQKRRIPKYCTKRKQ